jgi:RNA polymerase sigma-70 factor (ECF subfamily)
MAKQADEELVAALERRDECALEEIDRRYRSQLRNHARRLLAGSGVDPDDLVQETVLRAWSNPPAEHVALAAWLHVVLRNRGVDILRSPAVRRASDAPVDPDRRPARDVVAEASERERLRELVGALQDLPTRQARALILHVLEGRPQREIASELGTSTNSVKALVHRARHELAGRIEWSQTG